MHRWRHNLRHSAARHLRRAGVDKSTIKEIGGWKTDAMFYRYDIVDTQDQREAQRKLALHLGSRHEIECGGNQDRRNGPVRAMPSSAGHAQNAHNPSRAHGAWPQSPASQMEISKDLVGSATGIRTPV
ncbi:MAG TPA: tyrosine-type recombinase/integrase [Candidatus Polarisedimenticolaceae bacterium]|nr:tyrosine-type recombinase/integrase [Candidatus Polarisedimenticolaceae bacterium]